MKIAFLLALTVSPAALEERGIEAMYNLRFAEAQASFQELTLLDSDSPAGPYYQAAVLWMEEITRLGGLSGATFRNNRFWSRVKKDGTSPEFKELFLAALTESNKRSDQILAEDPHSADALYFKGFTESMFAAYYASMEHSYYSAYKSGKKAKEFHRLLLEKQPDYADACLIPGIFEYTVATLPRSMRFLAFLIGVRGSKETGLSLIERSVREGDRSQWAGRLALSVIYSIDKRYDDSLRVLEELEDAFPDNPLFVMERGSVKLLAQDWLAARSIFHEVDSQRRLGRKTFQLIDTGLVELRLGESYLFAKDPAQARKFLGRGIEHEKTPDRVAAALYLRRGMAWDRQGRREEAKTDYEHVLDLNVDKAINNAAKRYLRDAYK